MYGSTETAHSQISVLHLKSQLQSQLPKRVYVRASTQASLNLTVIDQSLCFGIQKVPQDVIIGGCVPEEVSREGMWRVDVT